MTIVLATLALVVAACGAGTSPGTSPGTSLGNGGDNQVTTTPPETTMPQDDTAPPDETTPPREDEHPPDTVPPDSGTPIVGEVPNELLDDILADASSRTGAPISEISVVRAEEVIWPDGSLGCPQPGESYTMALVDGYWVVLDAAGEQLDYRASAAGFFRLCEGPGAEPPTG